MKAEIISIGDEILIGQIVDTNSNWMAKQFNSAGISVQRIHTISDNKNEIIDCIAGAEKRADIILMTGGLGPTNDDLTKLTLCEYFDTKLVVNQMVLENVEQIIISKFGVMNELNKKQAEVPENCTVINNPKGTAPILWFEKDNVIYVAMPGVPYEMKHAITNEIIPRLQKCFQIPTIYHKTILTIGYGESFLAEKLAEWENNLPQQIKIAYLPSPERVRLRLSCTDKTSNFCENIINDEINKLTKIIPEAIYGFDDDTLQSVVGKLLTKQNKTLASAESCTGGYIAHLITSVSGSSEYYSGSVVAYSNDVKVNMLNVSKSSIDKYGVVSEDVAKAMAEGVREKLNTDFAIATTGIAGPSGARPEKPVGTVWIAVSDKNNTIAEKHNFGNDRTRNIMRASFTALNMLRLLINSSSN